MSKKTDMQVTDVVDDLGADIDTGIGRWLDHRAQVGLGDEVSLSLRDGLRRSVGLGPRLGVDIVLGARLSGSESVLDKRG